MIGSTKDLVRSSWVLGSLGCVAALALLVFASPAVAGCLNETLRQESNPDPTTGKPYSAGLPDCRAYEMVSPLYKQDRDAEGLSAGQEALPVAPGGDTAAWGSIGAFSNPENVLVLNMPYVSQREVSGWGTSSPFAPSALVAQPLGGGTGSDSSSDLRSVHVTCGASPVERGQKGTSALFTVSCARREQGSPWTSTPNYTYVDAQAHVSYYAGGSSDLTRVLLAADHPLLPSDTVSVEHGAGIYEIAGCCTSSSKLRLVNVDDNGNELVVLQAHPGEATEVQAPFLGDWRLAGGVDGSAYHAISASGGTVFFTANPNSAKPAEKEVLTVYARVSCGTTAAHSSAPSCKEDKEGREGEWFETVPVSNPSREECKTCIEATRQNATFQAASADGTKVFFTTKQELLAHDSTYNLYEYDFTRPEGEKLALLSRDATGARVVGVLRVSPDGSHVYFVAEGVLTEEPNGNGEKATSGRDNLYGYDTASDETRFVAKISGEIVPRNGSSLSRDLGRHAQTTPDGRYLVFSSAGSLAGDLNKSTAREQAVYRYDFNTGGLTWVSHGAPRFKVESEGEAKYEGEGEAALVASVPGTPPGFPPISADANIDEWSRAITEDGEYIIFVTAERLQVTDVNAAADVYEWHNGTVSMVSDGHDPAGVLLNSVALSSSGSDIFFITRAALVGQDTDVLRDVYDARMNRCGDEQGRPVGIPEAQEVSACQNVGGKVALAGYPRPEANSCRDDACQGPPSAPVPPFPPAASSLFTGGQNLVPALGSVAASTQAGPTRPTRAQQLAKALRACKGKPKRKRIVCEAQARKKYKAKATPKKKAKATK